MSRSATLSRLAPVAWTSPDGENWSLHTMGDTDYTFPVSLAVGADGTIVAVGRRGRCRSPGRRRTASRGPCTASRSSARTHRGADDDGRRRAGRVPGRWVGGAGDARAPRPVLALDRWTGVDGGRRQRHSVQRRGGPGIATFGQDRRRRSRPAKRSRRRVRSPGPHRTASTGRGSTRRTCGPAGPPRWPRVRTGSWPWARRSMSGRRWPGHRPMGRHGPRRPMSRRCCTRAASSR